MTENNDTPELDPVVLESALDEFEKELDRKRAERLKQRRRVLFRMVAVLYAMIAVVVSLTFIIASPSGTELAPLFFSASAPPATTRELADLRTDVAKIEEDVAALESFAASTEQTFTELLAGEASDPGAVRLATIESDLDRLETRMSEIEQDIVDNPALSQQQIRSMDDRVKTIEEYVIETPERALAVTLLRQDIEHLAEDIDDLERDQGLIISQIGGLRRLILTTIAAVVALPITLVLFVTQFLRAGSPSHSGDKKPADETKEIDAKQVADS